MNDAYLRSLARRWPGLLIGPDKLNWSCDWRHVRGVTEVKDQGGCGCCWAFAVTASVETAIFKIEGMLRDLSVQQLLDGDRHNTGCEYPCYFHSSGCRGGHFRSALQWVVDNGLQDDFAYPSAPYAGYSGVRGAPQTHQPSTAHITSFVRLPSNNEFLLAKAVIINPVCVKVRTDDAFEDLEFTLNEIYTRHIPATQTHTPHAMTIVGFGMKGGIPFWSVRNSWGKDWGYKGCLRMLRNFGEPEGLCGIARTPFYPII